MSNMELIRTHLHALKLGDDVVDALTPLLLEMSEVAKKSCKGKTLIYKEGYVDGFKDTILSITKVT